MKCFLIVVSLCFSSLLFAQNEEFKYKAEGYSSSCWLFCFNNYSGDDNSICDEVFSKADNEDGWNKLAINTERRIQLHEYWIKEKCDSYTGEKRKVCYVSGYQAVWCLIN